MEDVNMLNTEELKKKAIEFGADIVGIGDISLFEGTLAKNDPREIYPRAKSIIGLGFRVLKGTLTGLREMTQYYQYPQMNIVFIDEFYAPYVLMNLGRWMEDKGAEAVILRSEPDRLPKDDPETNPEMFGVKRISARSLKEGRPSPDVMLDFKQAAVICGLGEIGLGGFVITPEFGPLCRFAFILTDAELEFDAPCVNRTLCDDCGLCIQSCPGHAIEKNVICKYLIGKGCIEYAKLNTWQCMAYSAGAHKDTNPFMPDNAFKDMPQRDAIMNGTAGLDPETAMAVTGELLDYYPQMRYRYLPTICAKACQVACLEHLEQIGLLKGRNRRAL
jgi:ferredoxin